MSTATEMDPIDQLAYVNRMTRRLDALRREALFEARLQGNLEEAIAVSGLSRKRALAETRHENESRGRMIRWGRN